MTTVKGFKDFGVMFVEGDERSSSVKGHGDVYMSKDMAYGSNNESKTDHESIISFAWRPLNTLPDNPKFKYEVDIDAHSWRPLLDQSAVKPVNDKTVFTQAMADKGELPPVGSDAIVNVHGRGDFKAVVIGSHQRWVWLDVDGLGMDTFDLAWVHPIDTRTPKQKAVDAALKIMGFSCGGNIESDLSKIYDMWKC